MHAWGPSRFCRVRLFVTLWTVAHQFPLSVGFSRQEFWSGLPCLSPGDLPNPGTEPESPATPILQAESLLLRRWESPNDWDHTAKMCASGLGIQDPWDCSLGSSWCPPVSRTVPVDSWSSSIIIHRSCASLDDKLYVYTTNDAQGSVWDL